MYKVLIAAVAKNNVIGRSTGEIPWHQKEELQHFKRTTLGFPIVMGRKTFQSLGKPLKGRLNIVLTRDFKLKNKYRGVIIFSTLERAYKFCEASNHQKIFIIGGGQIFEKAITDADEMIISQMEFKAEGDVYFPNIDTSKWEISSREQRNEFEIVIYKRKG